MLSLQSPLVACLSGVRRRRCVGAFWDLDHKMITIHHEILAAVMKLFAHSPTAEIKTHAASIPNQARVLYGGSQSAKLG